MAYKELRLIKTPEKGGKTEKIKSAILDAYSGGNLPVFFNKYIRNEPVLVDGRKATMVKVSLPSKLNRRERRALNAMAQSTLADSKPVSSLPWSQRCTIDEALKSLVKNGEWNGLKLENYLNSEGAQNLARDFYGEMEHLVRNRIYRGGMVSPSRIRDKLLPKLKAKGIRAPINDVHLPWKVYFKIKDIYLSSPEKYGVRGGIDLLEKELKKNGTHVYRRHLESALSVIKQSTQMQHV